MAEKEGTAIFTSEEPTKPEKEGAGPSISPEIKDAFKQLQTVDEATVVVERKREYGTGVDFVTEMTFLPKAEKISNIKSKILEKYGSGDYILTFSAPSMKDYSMAMSLDNPEYPSKFGKTPIEPKEREPRTIHIREREREDSVAQLLPFVDKIVELASKRGSDETVLSQLREMRSELATRAAAPVETRPEYTSEYDRMMSENEELRRKLERMEEDRRIQEIQRQSEKAIEAMQKQMDILQQKLSTPPVQDNSLKTEFDAKIAALTAQLADTRRDKEMELQRMRETQQYELLKTLLTKPEKAGGVDWKALIPAVPSLLEIIPKLSGGTNLKEALDIITSIQQGQPLEVTPKEKGLKEVWTNIVEKVGTGFFEKILAGTNADQLRGLLGLPKPAAEEQPKIEAKPEPEEEEEIEEEEAPMPIPKPKPKPAPKPKPEPEPAKEMTEAPYEKEILNGFGKATMEFRKSKDADKAADMLLSALPDAVKPSILSLSNDDFVGSLQQIDPKITKKDAKLIFAKCQEKTSK